VTRRDAIPGPRREPDPANVLPLVRQNHVRQIDALGEMATDEREDGRCGGASHDRSRYPGTSSSATPFPWQDKPTCRRPVPSHSSSRRRIAEWMTHTREARMSGEGVIFKRCGCRDERDGKRLERRCPRLAERGHGSWAFHYSVTTIFGRRERVRRGGYTSRAAARAARDDLLQLPDGAGAASEADRHTRGTGVITPWTRSPCAGSRPRTSSWDSTAAASPPRTPAFHPKVPGRTASLSPAMAEPSPTRTDSSGRPSRPYASNSATSSHRPDPRMHPRAVSGASARRPGGLAKRHPQQHRPTSTDEVGTS
jgi:hypothetical protein